MNKEAIEHLTKNVYFWDNEGSGRIAQIPRDDYDQAIAKLRTEPKCKTCGGTGRYHNCDTWGCSSVDHINKAEPCPDCTEHPPASEFTKKVREDWDKDIFGGVIYKICARLDRSEASRKDLLTALEMLLSEAFRETDRLTWASDLCKQAETAIAKAKEVKK